MPSDRSALTVGALFCAFWLAAAGVATADPSAPEPEPDSTATPAATAGPPAIDGDGLYAVGSEIVPGVYASAGPTDGGTCYWRRIGPDDVTVANALTKQPQVVTIEAGDVAFKTRGCQPWQLTDGATPAGQNPPWLSQFQFRHQLDVLNGLAGQSGNGQLPAY